MLMTHSGFQADPGIPLIADTSLVINLNATGFSDRIIRAVPSSLVVTEDVVRELRDGSGRGYDDYEKLMNLIDSGTVKSASLGEQGEKIYMSLIEGSASQTLGDGEASTIGYAVESGGVVVIDDRKAARICLERFPWVSRIMTFDLLDCEAVRRDLGKRRQKEAVYNALRLARMRIPEDWQEYVVELIGKNLAVHCLSLSAKYRN